MIKLTDYEHAKLRLQAFDMLDGWGIMNERGIHVPHTVERRRELAEQFVDWALARAPEEAA